ncbi:MAG: helix-turn-helix domain-containing protein [Candidatus Omnitrophota bacterium]
MENKEYMSITEAASLLGISRQALHRQVKKGKIEAIRIGRSYAIPTRKLIPTLHKKLKDADKKKLSNIVKRVVKDYGETLQMLGDE